MIFKKYASPFDFLDGLSQMGMFEQGILNLLKEEEENKLWDIYLRTDMKKSFNDWKNELSKEPSEMSQMEITTQVEEADDILKTFRIERG